MSGKRILLHTCCGPCASASVERLLEDGWAVDMYYSNSNIATRDEFLKRLEGAAAVAEYFGVGFIEDGYEHLKWLAAVRGYEDQPEKGSRCGICFDFSLGRTAAYAAACGYDGFTTTLTISPHKSSDLLFRTGRSKGPFIEYDFKKKNGFARSIELSKELDLYRQQFCGCEFSIR